MQKRIEILHGDFGTVRNELGQLVNNEVEEIISLTHSTSSNNTNSFITIVIIFIPKQEEDEKQ